MSLDQGSLASAALNIVFSVTYYSLELHNAIIIYYLSHFLWPTKVELVVWTL